MTAFSDIEVLELRLQVDAAICDNCPVLIQVLQDLLLFLSSAFQVFASGGNSIVLSNWLH